MGPGEGEPDIVNLAALDMYCTRAPCLHATRRDLLTHPSMATPDSIAHVLASTLNPDSNVRIAAELNLSELLKNPRKFVWSLRVPFPLSSLDTTRRVRALTCTTCALSRCRVLFATDESYLSCVGMGRFLMTLCLCSVTSTRRSSYSGST